MKLNNLYFVQMRNAEWQDVNFVFTADNEDKAKELGMDMINPQFRAGFKVHKVEFICTTPDTVNAFEPV
jgi:hypothetical protein